MPYLMPTLPQTSSIHGKLQWLVDRPIHGRLPLGKLGGHPAWVSFSEPPTAPIELDNMSDRVGSSPALSREEPNEIAPLNFHSSRRRLSYEEEDSVRGNRGKLN